MMRDFNDLQFFAAVVQHHGFSAGARALGLPKSRVSRRVAVLEERLGVRLLDRTTRGMNLTEVGQQVFEHARAAVIEAEAAEEAALRMQSEPRGLVRMSCPLGLQTAIAADLPRFLAAHPRLRLQCIVTNRRVDLIHEGIDVAIRVRERLDTDAELQMKRIGVSKRILVASPTLLARVGEPSTPDELSGFPTLHPDLESPSVWRLATDSGDTNAVAIEPVLATGSLDILIASHAKVSASRWRRRRTARKRSSLALLSKCCPTGPQSTGYCISSLRRAEECSPECAQLSTSSPAP